MAEMRCPYCGNQVALHVGMNDGLGACPSCGAHYAVEARHADPDTEFAPDPGNDEGGWHVYAHVEEDGTPYTVVFF